MSPAPPFYVPAPVAVREVGGPGTVARALAKAGSFKWYDRGMLPILIISSAWLESEKTSHPDMAGFLGIDLPGGVPAAPGNVCPNGGTHPVNSLARFLVPVSDTSTAEPVDGRASVRCLCGNTYRTDAVPVLNVHAPIGEATL